MFKLQTNLTHFRFLKTKHEEGPSVIEWYKLEENEDNSESYGVCLNEKELQELQEYIKSTNLNFNSPKDFPCNNEDKTIPRCGTNDLKPTDKSRPINLVLRKKPLMTHKENTIFPCMDIELLNGQGEINHQYNLSFDLIGKIK